MFDTETTDWETFLHQTNISETFYHLNRSFICCLPPWKCLLQSFSAIATKQVMANLPARYNTAEQHLSAVLSFHPSNYKQHTHCCICQKVSKLYRWLAYIFSLTADSCRTLSLPHAFTLLTHCSSEPYGVVAPHAHTPWLNPAPDPPITY